jgi:hypothetical protein
MVAAAVPAHPAAASHLENPAMSRHEPLSLPAPRPVRSARIAVVAVALALATGSAFCREPAAAERPAVDRHPELKRLSPDEEVWVDPRAKRVIVGGVIAVAEGPIEYFACPEGTKEHESIVATKSTARLVHAGLLAIGLVPGKPVSFDPDYVAATGPRVRVTMRWKDEAGAVREVPAQQWIRDTRTGKPLAEPWVFAGSAFWKDPADGKEYYQADGGDLVCVSNFPTALLDLPIESSQSNEALLFEAFGGRVVPPRNTPVEMILSAEPATPATK